MGTGTSTLSSNNQILPDNDEATSSSSTESTSCGSIQKLDESTAGVNEDPAMLACKQAKIKKKDNCHSWEPTRMTAMQTSNVELSRTISQLAAANQQLATAHNRTLEQCQNLLVEVLGRKVGEDIASCPNCRSNARLVSTAAKTRLVLNKQSNKKVKKCLKKVSSIEESKDVVDAHEHEVETNNLRKEIERLKIFEFESEKKNEELMRDVEQQKLLIERLTQDFKDSQKECERKDKSLEEAKEQLDRSELETAKLLGKLKTFQCERREEESIEERRRTLDELTQQICTLEGSVVGQTTEVVNSASESSAIEEPSQLASVASVEEFKKELAQKREMRQRAMSNISSEMERLRRELESEKLAHSETTKLLESSKTTSQLQQQSDDSSEEHVEALRLLDLLKVSDEVSLNLRRQLERTDDLRFQLESEPEEHRQRISSLRRLAEEARVSLHSRRSQTAGLKDRLAQLLVRLGDEQKLKLLAGSDDIRREAERQLEDIARSRQLCDERSRILSELKDYCSQQLVEVRGKLGTLSQDHQSLEEEFRKTEEKVDTQDTEILNLESQLGLAKADCRELQNQMSLINSLFSQMLLGASSAEMDLDRLTQLLQENHDLITGMAKEKGTEAAALPKLLLDIVEQVDGREREGNCSDERKEESSIAHNLPKVWRILLELLSCQASSTSSTDATDTTDTTDTPDGTDSTTTASVESSPDSCYKSVDTPTGPRLVISVSKTYIRLKELILEKKHLEKEMNRMKQLNTHLETKLSEQEKRLSTVSDELSKTWNIVGRMQAQHQQLHTHEKILRYELQQKRKMLQELKQELEYCREKWESARQKNTNTEMEWKSLRREFAARKALVSHASAFSNSGESGFSDEREEESDEEEERDIGKRVRSRRRSKKDGARVMSPDTESEQPTDTESKASSSSSSTSGQQTPAAAASASESIEVLNQSTAVVDTTTTTPVTSNIEECGEELLDPLDKALAKVIENLLETDECTSADNESSPKIEPEAPASPSNDDLKSEEITAVAETKESNPIFSIGPIPVPMPVTAETEAKNRCQFGSLFLTDDCKPSSSKRTDCSEETTLDARAARLKSLEEQAEWLVKKVNDTNRRGSALNSRLEELHEAYGSIPTAPPMPDVLPAFLLRSELFSDAEASSPIQKPENDD